jgi:hypothetical protein
MAAVVHIPSQGLYGEVSFLVDTGADTSVLMPVDAERLGVRYGQLAQTTRTTGMGGESEDFVEPASLVFREDNDLLHVYDIALVIARQRSELLILPSLLGRDVISRWKLTMDQSSSFLGAVIVTSDDRFRPEG